MSVTLNKMKNVRLKMAAMAQAMDRAEAAMKKEKVKVAENEYRYADCCDYSKEARAVRGISMELRDALKTLTRYYDG